VARLLGCAAGELEAGEDAGREGGADAGGDGLPVQAAPTRLTTQRVATATHRLMIGSLDEVA
jgi:hypothetical protein